MTIALAIVAACVAAFLVWLLFDPVRVTLRAPDHGDPLVLKVRHAAVSFDAWIASDLGYGVVGHACGIPFDTRAVERAVRWGLARRKRRRDARAAELAAVPEAPPPREKALAKPRVPWGRLALDELPRIKRIARVDVLSIDLEYGTGDPVSTGFVGAALWQLCAVLPEHARIHAEASFTEERFHLEGEARLEIFPWRALVAGLSLAFGGLTWRIRTAKASSYPDGPESSSRMAAATPPPSRSSRS